MEKTPCNNSNLRFREPKRLYGGDQCDDSPKTLKSIERKHLAETYNGALNFLDEPAAAFAIENSLNKYYDLEDQCEASNLETNKDRVSKILSMHNIKKPPKLKSNLANFDITSLFNPLCCSNEGSLVCAKSENISEVDFKKCMEIFQKTDGSEENITSRKTAKTSTLLTSNVHRDQKLLRNNSEEGNSKTNPSSFFKTARDELNIQSSKKYGNSEQATSLQTGGQKRKLGIRRNVNSKFIPPLLSRTDSTDEVPKSEEWPSEVDERLKNIDPKMVELIKSEIMDIETSIEWADIAGLEFAKTSIQEAVVWPMLRPDIFTGLRRPPKGILLFGPPGTGKTLIGKCVASQSKSTFFSISASSLTSKWVGDGEKMVRALFSVARCYQPAVIFIDEIDSLLSQRSDTEHESSRRIKTEFLVQLDGATTDSEERLLLIGATNRPQELDEAARRRFVKRLYIPLPDYAARHQLVTKLISKERHELELADFEEIAKLSDGFSGADIRNLCSEASLGPIRSIDKAMIEKIHADDVRPLTLNDFQKAFTRVRTSVSSKDLDQYVIWDQTYGSGL